MRKSFVASVLAGVFCSAIAAEAGTPLNVPSVDKKSGITLQLSEGWKNYASKDGSVTIDVPMSGVHIQVWALSEATVDDAIKNVADLIKGQVTKFKVTETKPITVAGAPGKQLTGTGEEADDGDPANAEVYLFTVDGKVFMVCAHGEGDGSVKNRPLLATLLESVKKS
ncbi:MAG: hypothetical protein ABIT37_04665 [Luteolibacter sp.]